MARYIHCKTCSERMAQLANQYGELYETIEGKALYQMMCDDCGIIIKPKDNCFAAVLLDNSSHPNYLKQHPSAWSQDYLSQQS